MDAQERIERNTIISFFAGTGNRLLDAASGILFANVAGASALGIYYTFVSLYQLINRINSIGLGDAIIKQVSEYDRPDGDGGTEIIPNLIGAALAIRGVTVTVTSLGVILFRSRLTSTSAKTWLGWHCFSCWVFLCYWGSSGRR